MHQNFKLLSHVGQVGLYLSAAAHVQPPSPNSRSSLVLGRGITFSGLIQNLLLTELLEKGAHFSVSCTSFPEIQLAIKQRCEKLLTGEGQREGENSIIIGYIFHWSNFKACPISYCQTINYVKEMGHMF